MNAALKTTQANRFDVPPAGSFGRVLRRTDRDVGLLAGQVVFDGYDCKVVARGVEHPDGVRALTLFFPKGKDATAERARHFGWTHVSALWADHQTPRPSSLAEIAAMDWSKLLALAEELDVRANGVKRETVAENVATKLGISEG